MIFVFLILTIILVKNGIAEVSKKCEYTECHSKTTVGHCPSGLFLVDYESCKGFFQKRELCCPPKTENNTSKTSCRWTPCHSKLDSDFCDPETEFVRNFKSCGFLKKKEECCPQSALDRI
ncbi:unnamed protein product [Caenorhabditis angaria]|uniref:Domain of unknown function DX domain-containing protein n=1 Tax=Caenorhabditis angaria TaxID=860376 RepID=A0A9P1IBZ2_9PELO|nr:unnamed protein product [Caenorhabditis angaria]